MPNCLCIRQVWKGIWITLKAKSVPICANLIKSLTDDIKIYVYLLVSKKHFMFCMLLIISKLQSNIYINRHCLKPKTLTTIFWKFVLCYKAISTKLRFMAISSNLRTCLFTPFMEFYRARNNCQPNCPKEVLAVRLWANNPIIKKHPALPNLPYLPKILALSAIFPYLYASNYSIL